MTPEFKKPYYRVKHYFFMENLDKPKLSTLKKFKRYFLFISLLALGSLLILDGFGALSMSLNLVKYSGIYLIALGLIYYFVE